MYEIIKKLTIRELFNETNTNSKSYRYVVPIYQRNYAWHKTHIFQLIQDIYDYYKNNHNKPYYIGTLISFKKENGNSILYEVIDGQQRFTTLSLLLDALKNYYTIDEIKDFYTDQKLIFESRDISSATLNDLFNDSITNHSDYDSDILEGYNHIIKGIDSIISSRDILKFASYLSNNVSIFRVLVPDDTDLNHYFEIMNNRGEQLEKHEILKSYCLQALKEEDRFAFNYIWEACSNMEEYVQIQFRKEERHKIFGSQKDEKSLNNLVDINEVYSILGNMQNKDNNIKKQEDSINDTLKNNITQNISDLIENGIKENDSDFILKKDDFSLRFNSVMTFPNFLLVILRIQTQLSSIKLDDKRLLQFFQPFLNNSKDEVNKEKTVKFVKDFGYNLLKCKFLYDKYIIKRETRNNKEQWSLKKVKYYPEYDNFNYVNTFGDESETTNSTNHQLIMILSMFHVSTPTQVYKYWLYASLKYLFDEVEVLQENYLNYLENLAKAYFFDRFISTNEGSRDYDTIIDINNGQVKNNENMIDFNLLNYGTKVENFVFNYLDYLLWVDFQFDRKWCNNESVLKEIRDSRILNYEFGFRSSVEHYYPQQPKKELGFLDLERKYLDNFGNLCLLSSSKNSSLSNFTPKQKKEFYSKSKTIDSIKQCIMMACDNWWVHEIELHDKIMKKILLAQLANNS